ncbi:3'(2'),5'-bisphosphate nucleotidase CysQ family protein [Legionella londiniensis]|uniref:3'(2'),5-bisphosphonucleoside 3'(2')-phosphohydrolase n=1 Tax=Legionella londiniensis TaxID=45068 RepID=A0A0W0VN62_9GAMM|nr:3'(2'),5'-bisphosphate nucleotidase CysQ [Legionella londiniensis]KTD21605.1 inositol-1-monophosphatase [Legionella londiniensis]STX93376.1 myo-inositol-1(or 4)-monophosphatase [Legionella londiniensis]
MAENIPETGKTIYLADELHAAIHMVREAGSIAKKISQKNFSIRNKNTVEYNPVTDADEAVSDFLIEKIKQFFPEDIVISEEGPVFGEAYDNKRIWFIDPIDGTQEFIKGIDEWSVMIGLVVNGRPCLGVVYQPTLGHLYYAAKGSGAFLLKGEKHQKLEVRAITDSEEAVLIQSRSHWSPEAQKIAERMGIKKFVKQGSIGLKLGKIAEGEADLYFNFSGRCHLWDVCGPEIILEEAGGEVFLASGKKIDYAQKLTVIQDSFFAASALLAKEVRNCL